MHLIKCNCMRCMLHFELFPVRVSTVVNNTARKTGITILRGIRGMLYVELFPVCVSTVEDNTARKTGITILRGQSNPL